GRYLGEALGKAYVEKVFPPAAKAKMQDMVKNILAALHEDINIIEWMTDETRKKALTKLATFTPKVGYPDRWQDYSSLTLTRASYFDNVIAAEQLLRKDRAAQIGKPVQRYRWGMTTPTSNAYYSPLRNEIVFPA